MGARCDSTEAARRPEFGSTIVLDQPKREGSRSVNPARGGPAISRSNKCCVLVARVYGNACIRGESLHLQVSEYVHLFTCIYTFDVVEQATPVI